MPNPRVLILRAPGTNCDEETALAFDRAGGQSQRIHVNQLFENRHLASEFQILCIPGGFSYGDDISAGRILASRIQHRLGATLQDFRAKDKLILGICNGFQTLMKTGLLVDADAKGVAATLTWNDSGRYEDRWVNLAVDHSDCVFLRNVERMYLPVAHAEGRFVTRDKRTLASLASNGQLVLRYAPDRKTESDLVPYPHNPNGSAANVAGVCDSSGHVLGLMPHPERHIDATHHPRWTRRERGGSGHCIFENAIKYFLES